jgi:hypothetical protein
MGAMAELSVHSRSLFVVFGVVAWFHRFRDFLMTLQNAFLILLAIHGEYNLKLQSISPKRVLGI